MIDYNYNLARYEWKSYWRTDDNGHADCGIYFSPQFGQAYSICRAPKYITEEQWAAIASHITKVPELITYTEVVAEMVPEDLFNEIEAEFNRRRNPNDV